MTNQMSTTNDVEEQFSSWNKKIQHDQQDDDENQLDSQMELSSQNNDGEVQVSSQNNKKSKKHMITMTNN